MIETQTLAQTDSYKYRHTETQTHTDSLRDIETQTQTHRHTDTDTIILTQIPSEILLEISLEIPILKIFKNSRNL